ncbi:hypothetical protein GJ744_007097 [Endocarpon pusillum]|uniref:Uncharacterized protein n=1 Tax=Endocarpon pusillum TaxID=364733 RepID=A0A8H7E0Q8_9EURO|nr:hypothetical protein GJ744_007097 [Endocarpon pusillum]
MAPRAKSAPGQNDRRKPRTGRHSANPIVRKPGQAAGAQKSSRLHPVQSSNTPSVPFSQPARTKRKHPQECEAEADKPKDERPAKQPRKGAPSHPELSDENLQKDSESGAKAYKSGGVSEQPKELPPLSRSNLQILDNELMNSAAPNSPALKRTLSRRSITASEAETTRSQRSSGNTAFYRHKNLTAVQIRIHAQPPECIQAAINRIVNRKVSKERRAELRLIAQEFREGCLKNVRAQSGEDDFLDPLHTALKSLGLKNLCLHEKADWREELKPVVQQQQHFSSSFMAGVHQLEVDGASARPRKRQQRSAGEYMSPKSSMTNAPIRTPANNPQELRTTPLPPSPTPEKEGDRYPIKTPRPDLTMGIELTALISTLSSQNLSEVRARTFLEWLQNEMVQYKPDGPLEPMLSLVPAPRALDLAFPFAIVEGKAYSTGRQIFEAENQAAVSGACGLKIQIDLDNLVNHAITSSASLPTTSTTEPPLFFSITTQGPIHELWVHWTVVEDGVRMFESKLLDSCNALLLEGGEGFMVKLNNVGFWGTGPFVDSVVKRLGKVARKAKT